MQTLLREMCAPKFLAKLCVGAATCFALACSGGGGDGGGSGGIPRTGIRVAQGAIDAAPVELWTQGAEPELLGVARFGAASSYGSVGKGDAVFSVTRALSPDQVFASVPVSVADKQRYTVLFTERDTDQGLQLVINVVEDAGLLELPAQSGAVRVLHGLSGASNLVIRAGGQEAAAGLGGGSGYLTVAAGPVAVEVVDQATGRQVASLSLTLGDKEAQSVFVSGEQGYFVATSVLKDK